MIAVAIMPSFDQRRLVGGELMPGAARRALANPRDASSVVTSRPAGSGTT